jgi:hypothetical protein
MVNIVKYQINKNLNLPISYKKALNVSYGIRTTLLYT